MIRVNIIKICAVFSLYSFLNLAIAEAATNSLDNMSLGESVAANYSQADYLNEVALKSNNSAYDDNLPITVDNRIKTYIYNPNEIYLLVLHFGFQSHIEFAKGEEIETLSLGDTYAWKLTPLGNRLFIKPMEKNIRTNMTIITNKRTYQFDLVAKDLDDEDEKDLVYLVRFFYPKKK
ncbi:MAG: Type secretion system protein VirB9 [Rickettsiaceae bacterium]|jgi:type IV secretion system protein VirB9|nr:Type secretion system protein VirB9 [Rickettsiaceae bacterium]